MVEVEEYESQLAQRRAQLEASRSSIQSTPFNKPVIPQRLLRTLTPAGQLKVRQQVAKARGSFEEQKQAALGEVEAGLTEQQQLEAEFAPYKQSYEDEKAYNRAVELYVKKVPYAFVEGPEGKFLRDIYQRANLEKGSNVASPVAPKTTQLDLPKVTNKDIVNPASNVKTITPQDLGVRAVNINLMGDTKKVSTKSNATKSGGFNLTGFSILPLASAANESSLANNRVGNVKKFNLPKINLNPFKVSNPGTKKNSVTLNKKTIKNFKDIKWY